jgi:predicted transcriptional regulator
MRGAQNKIIDLLRVKEVDLTISQIASETRMDRHTAAKHLESLKSKGLVENRNIGKSKLWKLTKSPLIEALKEDSPVSQELKKMLGLLNDKISIQDENQKVIWHNQDKNALKCHELHWDKKEKCEECPADKVFEKGKPTKVTITGKKGINEIIMHPIKDSDGKTIAFIEIIRKIPTKRNKNG